MKMSRRTLGLVSVALLTVAGVACSGGGSSESGGDTVPTGSQPADTSGGGSKPGGVVHDYGRLEVTALGAEVVNSVTGTITPKAGGNISVTSVNGTTTTLKVPPNSVSKPITVTVTPAQSLMVGGVPRDTVGAVVISPQVVLPAGTTLVIEPDHQLTLDDWDLYVPIGFDETDSSEGIIGGLDELPPLRDDSMGDANGEGGDVGDDGDPGSQPTHDMCAQPMRTYVDDSGVEWTVNASGPPWWTASDGRVAYAAMFLPDFYRNCPRPPCPSTIDSAQLAGTKGSDQWYVDANGALWRMMIGRDSSSGEESISWFQTEIVDIATAEVTYPSDHVSLVDIPGYTEECGVGNAITDATGTVLPPVEGDDGSIEIPFDGLAGGGIVGLDGDAAADVFDNGTDPEFLPLDAFGLLGTVAWNLGLPGGGSFDPNSLLESEEQAVSDLLPDDLADPRGAWTEGLSDFEVARALAWAMQLQTYLPTIGVGLDLGLDPGAVDSANALLESFVGWLADDVDGVESPAFSGGDCLDEDGDLWCDDTDGDLVDAADDADGDGVPNADDDDDDGDGVADDLDDSPFGDDAYYFDWYFDDAPVDEPVGDVNGDGITDYYGERDVDGDGTGDCYFYFFDESGYRVEFGGNCDDLDVSSVCGDYCDLPVFIDDGSEGSTDSTDPDQTSGSDDTVSDSGDNGADAGSDDTEVPDD